MMGTLNFQRFARWFARSDKRKLFGAYEVITKTGQVSPQREVPENVTRPPYISQDDSTLSENKPSTPEVKDLLQIEGMRAAGKLARKILNLAGEHIQAGITTDQIDAIVHEAIISNGAYPSPLGYKNFPKSVCTSVNNVVCHGIPDSRALLNGDIVNVDVTVFFNGFHGDCSETYAVGNVDDQGVKLLDVTKKSLDEALKICKPGLPFKTIGSTIQSFVHKNGFQVVPVFTGHGIGSYFHGPPDIFHCRNSYPGIMLPGMTFTIEPAVSQGSSEILILEDGWTAVTRDGSRAAQFEHTILVTDKGIEILTE